MCYKQLAVANECLNITTEVVGDIKRPHLLTRPSLQATLVTHCSNSDFTTCTLISL